MGKAKAQGLEAVFHLATPLPLGELMGNPELWGSAVWGTIAMEFGIPNEIPNLFVLQSVVMNVPRKFYSSQQPYKRSLMCV